jgi:hypothetical protein
MARPDGVFIVSQRFWAFAAVDGGLLEGSMPHARTTLKNIPLLRGLLRLGAALSPIIRARGAAPRRERWFLILALFLPVGFAFLPAWVGLVGGIALTVALLAWIFRGRTVFLHGAEHRAIAAAESRRLFDAWHGRARPSRYAVRCGTNFAALALPITLAADLLWPFTGAFYTQFMLLLLSLAFAMEIWLAVQAAPLRIARVLLAPGLALQRLTTREPKLEETRVALRAVASVLEREALPCGGDQLPASADPTEVRAIRGKSAGVLRTGVSRSELATPRR